MNSTKKRKYPTIINSGEILNEVLQSMNIPENDKIYANVNFRNGRSNLEYFKERVKEQLKNNVLPKSLFNDAIKYHIKDLNNIDLSTISVGSMMLLGAVGVGKTTFLASKYIETLFIFSTYSGNHKTAYFLSFNDLLTEMKSSLNTKSFSDVIVLKKYRECSVLFLDDIFTKSKDSEYEFNILYQILEYRFNNYLPTLITSNNTVDDFLSMKNGKRFYRRMKENAELVAFTDDK